MPPLLSVGDEPVEDMAVNSANTYEYQALERRHIRLLEIQPQAASEAPICCTLHHINLDEYVCQTLNNPPPPYKALSYAWGPIGHEDQVAVDGSVISIRKSLGEALRALRPANRESLWLWVDALCIDQENHDEKGSQVGMMRTIYESATEVLVWLGMEAESPEPPIVAPAWKLLQAFDLDHTVNLREPYEVRKAQYDGLVKLFRRPYWWRIWVVQEVLSSDHVTVCCDHFRISWNVLTRFCEHMEKANIPNVFYHDSPDLAFSLTSGPRRFKPSGYQRKSHDVPPDLLDLLYLHGSKDSSRPQDKVYSLVGLSSSRELFGVIDYHRSIRRTYMHTTHHIITVSKKLDVVCFQRDDENEYDLPSWVIDWTRRIPFPEHRVMPWHIREPPFKASRDSNAKASFLQDDAVLRVAGFVLDTVQVAGESFRCPNPKIVEEGERHNAKFERDNRAEIKATLKAFANWYNVFRRAKGPGLTPEDLKIFDRTMCGGNWAPSYTNSVEGPSKPLQRLILFFGLVVRLDLVKDFHLVVPTITSKAKDVKRLSLLPIVKQDGKVCDNMELRKLQHALVHSAALRMHAKRFVISDNLKLAALGSDGVEIGDSIVIFFGCACPVIMRRAGSHWKLVGEVYVDGMMMGEAMELLNAGSFSVECFDIW